MSQIIKKINGFSLIELSLVIIIIGLVYAAIFNAYGISIQQDRMIKTAERARLVQALLDEFRGKLGHYPCPARLELPASDINYGSASCLGAQIAGTGQDANNDGVEDQILIGALPAETIEEEILKFYAPEDIREGRMTAKDMVDAWGNKFTYVVTQNLTNSADFNYAYGAIDVVDEYGDSLVNPPHRAHLVIVSHGPNGRGAYTRDGVEITGCNLVTTGPPPAGPTLRTDLDNCDHLDGEATYMSGLVRNSDSYPNDDLVRFSQSRPTSLWRDMGRDGSGTQKITNTNNGFVGIGVEDPQQQLHINGNLRAGVLRAEEVCDSAGDPASCMPVSVLAGDEDDMECDNPTDAIVYISRNKVGCAPVFSAPSTGTCDAALNEFMVGVRSDGTVICESL